VVGCNPLQLRAAFEHLRALVSIVVVLRERWHRKYIIGTLRAAATKVADRDPTACALSLLPAVCLPFACLLPAVCLPFACRVPAQAHQQDRDGHEPGGGAEPDAGADSEFRV